jgi:hypothetical protein
MPEMTSGKTPPVETDGSTTPPEVSSGKTPPREGRDVGEWLSGQHLTRPLHEQRVTDDQLVSPIGGSIVGGFDLPSEDSSQYGSVEHQDLNMNSNAKYKAELQKLLDNAPQNQDDETTRTPGKKRKP